MKRIFLNLLLVVIILSIDIAYADEHLSVKTGRVYDITKSSANIELIISSTGGQTITSYGVQIGTSPHYGSILKNDSYLLNPEILSVVSSDMICSTTYYYRAFVTSDDIAVYGSNRIFRTSPCLGFANTKLSSIFIRANVLESEYNKSRREPLIFLKNFFEGLFGGDIDSINTPLLMF